MKFLAILVIPILTFYVVGLIWMYRAMRDAPELPWHD